MTTQTAGLSPEKLAQLQQLQSMTPEQQAALVEEHAAKAEAEGNVPLATFLRAEAAKSRGPSVARVSVTPGNIPLLPRVGTTPQPKPGQSIPTGRDGGVDVLRHLVTMHSNLADLQSRHVELMRVHTELLASHNEVRAALNTIHNNHVATHALVTELHSDLYGQKKA